MEIINYSPSFQSSWDQYVAGHPGATYCHLIGWQKVIKRTYGHADHYLLAEEKGRIAGVLPLFRLKSLFFGDSLISMPFLDYGGLLSDDDEVGRNLLMAAIDLAHRLRVDGIELRHIESPQWLEGFNQNKNDDRSNPTGRANLVIQDRSSAKIRMLLQLPENSEYLMKSFKSKLRSQITKPLKEGCSVTFGGAELLDDFYKVFSINMRDLGSPVHEKKLFRNLFDEFPDKSKIFLVSKDNQCVAVSIVIGFEGVLENPWASLCARTDNWALICCCTGLCCNTPVTTVFAILTLVDQLRAKAPSSSRSSGVPLRRIFSGRISHWMAGKAVMAPRRRSSFKEWSITGRGCLCL